MPDINLYAISRGNLIGTLYELYVEFPMDLKCTVEFIYRVLRYGWPLENCLSASLDLIDLSTIRLYSGVLYGRLGPFSKAIMLIL